MTDHIEAFMYGATMLLVIDDEGFDDERTDPTDREAVLGACEMILDADAATPSDMALRNFAAKTIWLVGAIPRGHYLAAAAVRDWHRARNEYTALQIAAQK
jgi:hypothetical protein